MGFGKLGIKADSFLQQRFNLMPIQTWIFRSLSFPKTHCVVIVSVRIARLQFRKALEALDDLIRLTGRAVIGFGKEEIASWIGRAEIGGTKQRFDRLVVVPARVKSNTQSDRHPGRIRVT